MRIRSLAVAALMASASLTGTLGLAACSGSSDPAPSASATTSPADRLANMKTAVDSANSVHLTLTSKDLPGGITGLRGADGVAKPKESAFKGTFKASIQGMDGDADVVALGGNVWAKLPFVPGMNQIDPASVGFPDPGKLFGTSGLTTLLTKTTNPAVGTDVRAGSEVVHTITGTLPGKEVVGQLTIGDPNATYEVTWGYVDSGQLRTVDLVGPFYNGVKSTYTLTLDKYNEPVEITQP